MTICPFARQIVYLKGKIMSEFDSRLIIERMRKIENVQNDKDLAERISVEASTLSKWKSRNSLPIDKILTFANDKGISIDWLISGKEAEQLATDEQMMLLAYRQLSPTQKVNLMMQMSGLGNGASGGVVQNGDGGNNNQVFNGNVREVTGIRK